MPSAFASAFNSGARALLWKAHAEAVTIRLDGKTDATIQGIWKRVQAEGAQEPDGAGLTTYTGLALFVVKRDDLPELPDDRTTIIREGETWHVRTTEPQDAWTYILHLSRRKADDRPPR
jgi:hypothetical protein